MNNIITITRIDCACGCVVGEGVSASRQCDDFNTAERIGVTCQVNCNARTCIEEGISARATSKCICTRTRSCIEAVCLVTTS